MAAAEIDLQIQRVPWARLAHAYGFAGDAQRMLTELVHAPAGPVSDGAIDWMWSSMLHQGSVYSASVPAVHILAKTRNAVSRSGRRYMTGTSASQCWVRCLNG